MTDETKNIDDITELTGQERPKPVRDVVNALVDARFWILALCNQADVALNSEAQTMAVCVETGQKGKCETKTIQASLDKIDECLNNFGYSVQMQDVTKKTENIFEPTLGQNFMMFPSEDDTVN